MSEGTETLFDARAEALAVLATIEEHDRLNAQRHHADRCSLLFSARQIGPLLRAFVAHVDWASRMPDAGFNSDDPRWGWWHERPR